MKLIEWINGVTKLNKSTMDGFQSNIKSAIEALYPVGSVYMNLSDGTNPGMLLGFGTWERIKDEFIYALGDEGEAGDTGGSSGVMLTASQIPTLLGTTNMSGEHGHIGVSLNGSEVSVNNGTDGSGLGFPITTGKRYERLVVSSTGSEHVHGVAITNNNQQKVEIMPPHKKAYMWERIA